MDLDFLNVKTHIMNELEPNSNLQIWIQIFGSTALANDPDLGTTITQELDNQEKNLEPSAWTKEVQKAIFESLPELAQSFAESLREFFPSFSETLKVFGNDVRGFFEVTNRNISRAISTGKNVRREFGEYLAPASLLKKLHASIFRLCVVANTGSISVGLLFLFDSDYLKELRCKLPQKSILELRPQIQPSAPNLAA